MMKPLIIAAVLASLLAPPAMAEPLHVSLVKDTPSVTFDKTKSYFIVQIASGDSNAPFPLAFVRQPDSAVVADYLARRKLALEKAHKRWVSKHALWERTRDGWLRLSPDARAGRAKPVEPVEPTDGNLAFPPIELENMLSVGPTFRFAKDGGRSTFIVEVPPGRYAFYGNVFVAAPAVGTCMCMGTIDFEVKTGQIVNVGSVSMNITAERQRAKSAGQPMPSTEMELPETINSYSWTPPAAGDEIDPRLAGLGVVPAELHAARRFPNYFGLQIDRLTAIPGVLAYDRDRIIDVKAQTQGN